MAALEVGAQLAKGGNQSLESLVFRGLFLSLWESAWRVGRALGSLRRMIELVEAGWGWAGADRVVEVIVGGVCEKGALKYVFSGFKVFAFEEIAQSFTHGIVFRV